MDLGRFGVFSIKMGCIRVENDSIRGIRDVPHMYTYVYICVNTVEHRMGVITVGCPWGQIWLNSTPFDPQHTIPIRARAYNDCAKHAVLLKTASNGPLGLPQNGSILGPSRWYAGSRHRFSEDIRISMVCVNMCRNIPPNGTHFGVYRMTHQIHGSGFRLGWIQGDPGW